MRAEDTDDETAFDETDNDGLPVASLTESMTMYWNGSNMSSSIAPSRRSDLWHRRCIGTARTCLAVSRLQGGVICGIDDVLERLERV